ncbi:MAG: T9SS type A sorting domain-containing protein [Ignavibacteriaceae bacterium]
MSGIVSNRSYFRSSLLFLIVLISIPPLSGQTTVTLGTQLFTSGASSISEISPYNYYYKSRRVQFVYTASEILAAGGFAGSIISMAIDVSQINGGDLSNYTIKMGHTTATDASSHNTATLTTVKNAHTLIPGLTGWRTITFDTGFPWNGTENLLVDICWGVNAGSGSNGEVWLYNSSLNQMRGVAGSTDKCGSTTTSTTIGKPRAQFTINILNMSVLSSTTEQGFTTHVFKGSIKQEIIRLKIVTQGSANPISVSSVVFNTTGSTAVSDLTSAKVYYTTTATFTDAVQFGLAISSPSGSLTFDGSRVMSWGDNYFWLAYDISSSAMEYHVADGTCTGYQLGTIKFYNPAITDPAGSRVIRSPLSGTYTINPDGSGTRNYTTFAAAVTDLNTVGVSASVIFNVAVDKTFNENPLTITTTGISGRTITFQKSGTGAKPIINFNAPGSGLEDSGFKLSGSDYFIFDGLDIRDAGTSTENYLENGFFLSASVTDGCQYNIIKNCNINMTKTYGNSRGVCTQVSYTPSGASSMNSNNKFYNNYIQDCYIGYDLGGYPTAGYPYYRDTGNEIGIDGGTSTITDIASAGIFFEAQDNLKIFNTEISNISGSGSLKGIYSSDGSKTVEIYNNNINTISSTSTSYGIYIWASTSSDVINKICNNTFSGFTSTAGFYGVYVTVGATDFYSNIVSGISGSGGSVYGAYLIGNGTNNIYKNKIYDLSYAGSSSGTVEGLSVGSTGTNSVYNNFIYDIKAPSSTATPGTRGITITNGTANYIFNNTVFLNYTSAVAGNQSAALYLSIGNFDLRNNILVNKTNMTTGTRAACIYTTSTSLTGFSTNSNNNIYYAGTPGTKNLIYYDGTNSDQTLTDYKTRMSTRDQGAMTEDVPFISSAEVINPHIQTDVETHVESRGMRITTPFAVTDDYDGTIRALETGYAGSGAAPDVGADEGEFKLFDITPPAISYTPLGNIPSSSNRTLENVTITDASGVNITTGTRPRIYYKRDFDDNVYNDNTSSTPGWKYTESTTGSSPFTFTIDYSKLLGGYGALPGVYVQYFVVAQDLSVSHNVGINSGTFAATPSTVNLTSAAFPFTGTINSYAIGTYIAGTVTVGTGGTYPSLTGYGGLFQNINIGEVSGNITAQIKSDISEDGSNQLNQWTEAGAGNYTLTIKPDGSTLRTLSGSLADGLFFLNGADRVTVDGRNGTNSSLGGRYLKFVNSDSLGNTIIFKNDAISNTVRNCIIEGSANSDGVISFLTGVTSGNDFNLITGCQVRAISTVSGIPRTLIYSRGSSPIDSVIWNSDNSITNNEIFYFVYIGIWIHSYGNKNWTVSGNTVYNKPTISSYTTQLAGIFFNGEGTNLVSGNTIRDLMTTTNTIYYGIMLDRSYSTTVSGNRLYNFPSKGELYGILFRNNLRYGITVTNNQISIIPSGSTSQWIVGMMDSSRYADTAKVYYNSVYIGGTATGLSSWAFSRGPGLPSIDILKNNIFYNARTGGAGNHFAIGEKSNGTGVFSVSNNLYIGTGATANQFMDRGTDMYGTPETFNSWKTAKGDNRSYGITASEITATNLFNDISTGDLNIKTTNSESWIVNGKGAQLAGFPDDFGAAGVRSVTLAGGMNDIGSDEFTPDGDPPSITINPSPGANNVLLNGRNLGTITFGPVEAVLPTSLDIKYYSGVNPPGPLNGKYAKAYWVVNATGGSGYTYDLVLNYDPAMIGTIEGEDNIRLAKRTGGVWAHFPSSVVNTTEKTVTMAGQTSFSEFTLSDNNNPLPVELTSFSASVKSGVATLKWSTATEMNNYGYEIERSEFTFGEGSQNSVWEKIGFMAGSGNSNSVKEYSFIDYKLSVGKYLYRLKQIDNDGNYTYSTETEIENLCPSTYELQQNYPNPFNPSTMIRYDLPVDCFVTLKLYDVTGKEVAVLVREEKEAGYHNYELLIKNHKLASGVYFYNITAGDFTATKKMVLLK